MLTDICTLLALCHSLGAHGITVEKYLRLEMPLFSAFKGLASTAHSTLICKSIGPSCAVVAPSVGLNNK
eukprot:COSAG01_NODE_3898_length_5568_cov_2.935272_6_plen_69_part_00